MRHYVWFVFGIFYSLLLGLIAGCSSLPQLSSERSTLVDAVDSIKTAYIPDRRVQFFDFDLSDDGLCIMGYTSYQVSYLSANAHISCILRHNIHTFYHL